MAEKITVSWDDLQSRKVDTRLKEQEALARNRAYAQLDADAVTPQTAVAATSSGSIFYNAAVYMAIFGLLGGVFAWALGQVLVYKPTQTGRSGQAHSRNRKRPNDPRARPCDER